jgi:hypothetical protein
VHRTFAIAYVCGDVALTVFVEPVRNPNGSLVPVPDVNLVVSRSSFASARSPPSSCHECDGHAISAHRRELLRR